jgi:hypothetical protein
MIITDDGVGAGVGPRRASLRADTSVRPYMVIGDGVGGVVGIDTPVGPNDAARPGATGYGCIVSAPAYLLPAAAIRAARTSVGYSCHQVLIHEFSRMFTSNS